jgi:hypothetical protein
MRVLHKVQLKLAEVVQTLNLPQGAVVRAVQSQGSFPTIWYECDPDAPPEPRHFVIVGTGWELPDVGAILYLGTVQIGAYVWHVYEAGP